MSKPGGSPKKTSSAFVTAATAASNQPSRATVPLIPWSLHDESLLFDSVNSSGGVDDLPQELLRRHSKEACRLHWQRDMVAAGKVVQMSEAAGAGVGAAAGGKGIWKRSPKYAAEVAAARNAERDGSDSGDDGGRNSSTRSSSSSGVPPPLLPSLDEGLSPAAIAQLDALYEEQKKQQRQQQQPLQQPERQQSGGEQGQAAAAAAGPSAARSKSVKFAVAASSSESEGDSGARGGSANSEEKATAAARSRSSLPRMPAMRIPATIAAAAVAASPRVPSTTLARRTPPRANATQESEEKQSDENEGAEGEEEEGSTEDEDNQEASAAAGAASSAPRARTSRSTKASPSQGDAVPSRKRRTPWILADDDFLIEGRNAGRSFSDLARSLPGGERTGDACSEHWSRVLIGGGKIAQIKRGNGAGAGASTASKFIWVRSNSEAAIVSSSRRASQSPQRASKSASTSDCPASPGRANSSGPHRASPSASAGEGESGSESEDEGEVGGEGTGRKELVRWTVEENAVLRSGRSRGLSWTQIQQEVNALGRTSHGRTKQSCQSHYQHMDNHQRPATKGQRAATSGAAAATTTTANSDASSDSDSDSIPRELRVRPGRVPKAKLSTSPSARAHFDPIATPLLYAWARDYGEFRESGINESDRESIITWIIDHIQDRIEVPTLKSAIKFFKRDHPDEPVPKREDDPDVAANTSSQLQPSPDSPQSQRASKSSNSTSVCKGCDRSFNALSAAGYCGDCDSPVSPSRTSSRRRANLSTSTGFSPPSPSSSRSKARATDETEPTDGESSAAGARSKEPIADDSSSSDEGHGGAGNKEDKSESESEGGCEGKDSQQFRPRWTAEEDALLLSGRSLGLTYPQISKQVTALGRVKGGRSVHACTRRFDNMNGRFGHLTQRPPTEQERARGMKVVWQKVENGGASEAATTTQRSNIRQSDRATPAGRATPAAAAAAAAGPSPLSSRLRRSCVIAASYEELGENDRFARSSAPRRQPQSARGHTQRPEATSNHGESSSSGDESEGGDESERGGSTYNLKWTAEEESVLVSGRKRGVTFSEIGRQLKQLSSHNNRTPGACCTHFHLMQSKPTTEQQQTQGMGDTAQDRGMSTAKEDSDSDGMDDSTSSVTIPATAAAAASPTSASRLKRARGRSVAQLTQQEKVSGTTSGASQQGERQLAPADGGAEQRSRKKVKFASEQQLAAPASAAPAVSDRSRMFSSFDSFMRELRQLQSPHAGSFALPPRRSSSDGADARGEQIVETVKRISQLRAVGQEQTKSEQMKAQKDKRARASTPGATSAAHAEPSQHSMKRAQLSTPSPPIVTHNDAPVGDSESPSPAPIAETPEVGADGDDIMVPESPQNQDDDEPTGMEIDGEDAIAVPAATAATSGASMVLGQPAAATLGAETAAATAASSSPSLAPAASAELAAAAEERGNGTEERHQIEEQKDDRSESPPINQAATASAALPVAATVDTYEPQMFVFPCGHMHAPSTAAGFVGLVPQHRVFPPPPVAVAHEYALRERVACSVCAQRCSSLVIGHVLTAPHAGSAAAAAEAASLCISSEPSPATMLHSSNETSRAVHASLLAAAAGAAARPPPLRMLMVPCGHSTPVSISRDLLRSMQVDPRQPLQVGERHHFSAVNCKVCLRDVAQMIGCVDWS